MPDTPYATAYIYYTPLGRFSMVGISTDGIVSVPKSSAWETSRRELSEDVPFGIGTGTFSVVEQSSLENRPRGVMCDIYRRIRWSVRFPQGTPRFPRAGWRLCKGVRDFILCSLCNSGWFGLGSLPAGSSSPFLKSSRCPALYDAEQRACSADFSPDQMCVQTCYATRENKRSLRLKTFATQTRKQPTNKGAIHP